MTSKIKKNILNLKESSTLSINEKSKELIKSGKKIYRFGFGQSPFQIPERVVDTLKLNAHKKEYLPIQGLPELREKISNHLFKNTGVRYSKENILITPGSKEAMLLMHVTFNGEILTPAPSWVSYEPQAQIGSNKVHWLETSRENNWFPTAIELEKKLKKIGKNKNIIFILNSPNNPSGAICKNLKELAQVAKKYKLIILSDEIYTDLSFDNSYNSISEFYPEATFISGGLSKWCGAGGWRLGFFAIPNQFKKLNTTISNLATETFSAVSAPIQYAAIKAYNSNQDDYLSKSKNILKKIALEAYKKFNTNKIKVIMPDGGFYIMPDFSELLKNRFKNSVDMCNQLLKDTGVAVLPGCDFGFPKDKLVFRLSYVDFDGKKFLNSVSKDVNINDAHLKKFAPKIIEGIDKIINWSNKMSK